jgi:hypothetical protein
MREGLQGDCKQDFPQLTSGLPSDSFKLVLNASKRFHSSKTASSCDAKLILSGNSANADMVASANRRKKGREKYQATWWVTPFGTSQKH